MILRSSVVLALLLTCGAALSGQETVPPAAAARQLPLPKAQPGSLRRGRGAMATSRIAVDGRPVGRMERTEPMNELDSGWAFYAGDETREAVNDLARLGIYDLDVIARYDPAVAPYLDAPVGTDLVRSGDSFVPRP